MDSRPSPASNASDGQTAPTSGSTPVGTPAPTQSNAGNVTNPHLPPQVDPKPPTAGKQSSEAQAPMSGKPPLAGKSPTGSDRALAGSNSKGNSLPAQEDAVGKGNTLPTSNHPVRTQNTSAHASITGSENTNGGKGPAEFAMAPTSRLTSSASLEAGKTPTLLKPSAPGGDDVANSGKSPGFLSRSPSKATSGTSQETDGSGAGEGGKGGFTGKGGGFTGKGGGFTGKGGGFTGKGEGFSGKDGGFTGKGEGFSGKGGDLTAKSADFSGKGGDFTGKGGGFTGKGGGFGAKSVDELQAPSSGAGTDKQLSTAATTPDTPASDDGGGVVNEPAVQSGAAPEHQQGSSLQRRMKELLAEGREDQEEPEDEDLATFAAAIEPNPIHADADVIDADSDNEGNSTPRPLQAPQEAGLSPNHTNGENQSAPARSPAATSVAKPTSTNLSAPVLKRPSVPGVVQATSGGNGHGAAPSNESTTSGRGLQVNSEVKAQLRRFFDWTWKSLDMYKEELQRLAFAVFLYFWKLSSPHHKDFRCHFEHVFLTEFRDELNILAMFDTDIGNCDRSENANASVISAFSNPKEGPANITISKFAFELCVRFLQSSNCGAILAAFQDPSLRPSVNLSDPAFTLSATGNFSNGASDRERTKRKLLDATKPSNRITAKHARIELNNQRLHDETARRSRSTAADHKASNATDASAAKFAVDHKDLNALLTLGARSKKKSNVFLQLKDEGYVVLTRLNRKLARADLFVVGLLAVAL